MCFFLGVLNPMIWLAIRKLLSEMKYLPFDIFKFFFAVVGGRFKVGTSEDID
jgi:hypothetical protein